MRAAGSVQRRARRGEAGRQAMQGARSDLYTLALPVWEARFLV